MNALTEAIILIEGLGENEQSFSSTYMFTLENTKSVVKGLNVKNKEILTPTSSSDHIFEMLLNGASSVESYDINCFTKYYFYLKEAAVRSLTYNEFIEFFFAKPFSFNSKVFSNEVFFKKILPNIKDDEAKKFWNALFKRYNGKVLYNSKLFYNNKYNKNNYKQCNSYLENEENYRNLQEKLKNYKLKFYNLNILKDIEKIKGKQYDVIYLSNVLNSIPCKTNSVFLKKIKEVITNLKSILNLNGTIGLGYLPYFKDIDLSCTDRPSIHNIDFRKENLEGICEYTEFRSIANPNSSLEINKDALMLVRK